MRNYLPKKKNYQLDNLKEAIDKCNNKEMTLADASKFYQIPRSTINNHTNMKSLTHLTGRPPVLKMEQESLLVDNITTLSDWAFCLDIGDIQTIVQNFVRSLNIKTPFKDNMPGLDWITG